MGANNDTSKEEAHSAGESTLFHIFKVSDRRKTNTQISGKLGQIFMALHGINKIKALYDDEGELF